MALTCLSRAKLAFPEIRFAVNSAMLIAIVKKAGTSICDCLDCKDKPHPLNFIVEPQLKGETIDGPVDFVLCATDIGTMETTGNGDAGVCFHSVNSTIGIEFSFFP